MTVGESMTETQDAPEQPRSYRTLTRDDAIGLRVARYRELEREHYALGFVVEETGQETAEDQRRRLDVEARLRHHEAILWPSEADTAHDHGLSGSDHDDDHEHGEPGTTVETGGASTDGALAGLLGHTVDDVPVNQHDGPVEPDPDLPDGVLVHYVDTDGDGDYDQAHVLDDGQGLGPAADDAQREIADLDDTDDDPSTGRHGSPYDSQAGYIEYQREAPGGSFPTPLQRASHFPSMRDRD
jgi:hypothetical protein